MRFCLCTLQFLFTLAKYHGSEMSTNYFITHNLIPATIGNLIGGAFFVGTLHSLAVGDLFDTTYANAGG
jgi:formate/nitrite transporter FocA (FNT family)